MPPAALTIADPSPLDVDAPALTRATACALFFLGATGAARAQEAEAWPPPLPGVVEASLPGSEECLRYLRVRFTAAAKAPAARGWVVDLCVGRGTKLARRLARDSLVAVTPDTFTPGQWVVVRPGVSVLPTSPPRMSTSEIVIVGGSWRAGGSDPNASPPEGAAGGAGGPSEGSEAAPLTRLDQRRRFS